MGRRAKPNKVKAEAKQPLARKPATDEGAKVRDLEKRLADSLEREKATGRALTEALEQQTATSELLKVIGRSTFDLQPVFETLAENAARLCEAHQAFIFRFDGQLLRVVATHNISPELRAFFEGNPVAPGRGSIAGRAALDRRTIHIDDVRTDPEYTWGARQVDPIRTVLTIPMRRGDEVLGVIGVNRLEVRPFSDGQIALLETFADQAAIAIENARLFTELQQKNQALTQAHAQVTEALDQQTATSEILRVISASPTDVQPVFDSIVASAVRLCGGLYGMVYRRDGDMIDCVAQDNINAESRDLLGRVFPRPATAGMTPQFRRALFEGAVVVTPDIETDPDLPTRTRAFFRSHDTRSVALVPLLRRGEAIGVLGVGHGEIAAFSDDHVALLQTFADQAVIAIENVRLFTELQEKNREVEQKSRELEAASQHKSEFLANMSHELRTPLNAIIGFSEVLSEGMFGEINEKQTEYLQDILESGRHLLSLINDILDLSKIEAGRMELDVANFDLPDAIEHALILVRERATRRGIALQREIDERLGMIRADERKVKQVVLNLLSNALKFTPEGGRIDVLAGLHDDVAEISVSDTGLGIAPEDQEAVFEEFRQVGTADKKVEGTGLGLALSRKFIELHGGRIWVQSQVGVGSTFTFTLPVRRGE